MNNSKRIQARVRGNHLSPLSETRPRRTSESRARIPRAWPGRAAGTCGGQEPAGIALPPLFWDTPWSTLVRRCETLARWSAGPWAWASFWRGISWTCFPTMHFTLSPISLRCGSARAQIHRMENENAENNAILHLAFQSESLSHPVQTRGKSQSSALQHGASLRLRRSHVSSVCHHRTFGPSRRSPGMPGPRTLQCLLTSTFHQ